MKSILITFDQAYYERIIALLDRMNCRGFTYLDSAGTRFQDRRTALRQPCMAQYVFRHHHGGGRYEGRPVAGYLA